MKVLVACAEGIVALLVNLLTIPLVLLGLIGGGRGMVRDKKLN
ncbi:MAG TPA: hypothetical protein VKW04_13330 [Planctomycetota bacterium]|nr:hypothetical protein [Planctomycetota bacterium]